MSREEIERMLQVTDVRETRVFQEAKQEGLEEGFQTGCEQTAVGIATRLLRLGRPVAEVVEATGLSAVKVRALKKKLEA